jgi:hypothetical protein
MQLLDTFQGSFQDAYQWAFRHGMRIVSPKQITMRLAAGKSITVGGTRPERTFRFTPQALGQVNVGLWMCF